MWLDNQQAARPKLYLEGPCIYCVLQTCTVYGYDTVGENKQVHQHTYVFHRGAIRESINDTKRAPATPFCQPEEPNAFPLDDISTMKEPTRQIGANKTEDLQSPQPAKLRWDRACIQRRMTAKRDGGGSRVRVRHEGTLSSATWPVVVATAFVLVSVTGTPCFRHHSFSHGTFS